MWWDFIFGSVPNIFFWSLCAIVGFWGCKIKRLKELLDLNRDLNNHITQNIYKDIEKLKLQSRELTLTLQEAKEKYNEK